MKAVKSNFDFINKKAVKGIFLGALSGIIISVLLAIIFSFVIVLIGKLFYGASDYIPLIILALGSLSGGYISARIRKNRGIITGSATGLLMFIIIFTAGLSTFAGEFSLYILIKAIVMIMFSIIGAVIGVNKKEKQRYK